MLPIILVLVVEEPQVLEVILLQQAVVGLIHIVNIVAALVESAVAVALTHVVVQDVDTLIVQEVGLVEKVAVVISVVEVCLFAIMET